MPTVLRIEGFRFFFYSQEQGEPPHIHVEHGDKTAKYWLSPLALASSERFKGHELNRVRAMVIEQQAVFLGKWHEHFSR
jgi:hypothetical protein